MRAILSKVSIICALALLAPVAFPGSFASPPEAKIGVEASGLEIANAPPGFKAEQVRKNDLTPNRIKSYDILFLDGATLETLWKNPAQQQALRDLVNGHRALAVVNPVGDAFQRFGIELFHGVDTPQSLDASEGPAAQADVLFFSHKGVAHTFSVDATTPGYLEGSFVHSTADWLQSRPDFFLEGSSGQATAANNNQWDLRHSATYSYELYPYGVISYYGDFFRNVAESDSTYDWWVVSMDTITRPGYALWGTEWFTNVAYARSDVDYFRADHKLIDYGHGDIRVDAKQSITFEVGMRAGVDGAPINSTYATGYETEYMSAWQLTDKSLNDFRFQRQPDDKTLESRTSQTWPGLYAVRVPDGACLKVPYLNKAEWERFNWDGTKDFYQTWINSWREVC